MTRRWPVERIVLAYVVMTLIALASVWVVDRKVHLLPMTLPSSNPASPIRP